MAQIFLSPNDRSAVGVDSVSLWINQGWILSDLTNEDNVVQYRFIKQTYKFNFRTSNVINIYSITVFGAAGNDGQINVSLYGLAEGWQNTVEVDISYSYEVRYWETRSDPITGEDRSDWGDWETITNDWSNKGSLTVYTRNNRTASSFWGNPQSGNYIDDHITAGNVNDWINQLGIWASWKNQSDKYEDYDNYKNPFGDITANWYNILSNFCEGSYTVNQYNQYIAAEHFQDLARKVTTWE